MTNQNVAVSRTISATPEEVFAALADPRTHQAIDGTGWVRDAVDTTPLREVGQVFRMNMYHSNHPDGDYLMENRVEVIEPRSAIAWQPGQRNDSGELEFGGWTWRYDLVPVGESSTELTLTYDWSAVPTHIREYIEFPPFADDHLRNSLNHIAELVG
ncbi:MULTISPECIES: SRPBCC domain-containing protein [unclassified Gordonia (in: high G+C Gram-positive bacteria)]|uniref:SRPBCC domain-containing protein n=1 Tax=unclassified Gordonia (in: high G+C Gram-positive bacteria) TaxID=2657482 RepID=UPI001964CAD7|nr:MULTISPECIES: SRPBCC domain-containing protein [unclassified Gordonia (in: high G+C Gram-positive bacteria)]MBN0975165.1 SRPBCC family protein [Gordonia sp. BP-119]MBN0985309.1 SRPBCC family protein [Gordonia sp. BP-94]MBR7193660.1 SRPBCC family protein [Gordonia sp. SCSIO 19800]WGJ85230.1 SRPBCC family protein [Gordonia sp. SMJS1]